MAIGQFCLLFLNSLFLCFCVCLSCCLPVVSPCRRAVYFSYFIFYFIAISGFAINYASNIKFSNCEACLAYRGDQSELAALPAPKNPEQGKKEKAKTKEGGRRKIKCENNDSKEQCMSGGRNGQKKCRKLNNGPLTAATTAAMRKKTHSWVWGRIASQLRAVSFVRSAHNDR